MQEIIEFILVISTLIIISPFLSNILKIPVAIIEIFLGGIIGYFHIISPHMKIFENLAEIGFLYLMFLAGLEVNLKKLLQIDKNIYKLGIIFLAIMYILSFFISYILKLDFIFAISFTLISVGLILAVQKEVGKQNWLLTAMTVGIIAEVISIIVLTIVSGILNYGIGIELYKSLAILFAIIIILSIIFYLNKIIFWWFPILKHYLMPHKDNLNQDIRISFAVFFIFIATMEYLHLELALGAFVAGIFIATFFEHKNDLEHKLSPFGFGLLIPIFFIHIGSSFNINYILEDGLIYTSTLYFTIMVSIRLLASVVFIKIFNLKQVILFGLSLSMPLTLLITMITLAYNMNVIDDFNYNALILVAILEVLLLIPTIKIINKKFISS